MPQVGKMSIQTNLSCSLNWLKNCDKEKVALWATYHPTQTTMPKFLKKCQQLETFMIRILNKIFTQGYVQMTPVVVISGMRIWKN